MKIERITANVVLYIHTHRLCTVVILVARTLTWTSLHFRRRSGFIRTLLPSRVDAVSTVSSTAVGLVHWGWGSVVRQRTHVAFSSQNNRTRTKYFKPTSSANQCGRAGKQSRISLGQFTAIGSFAAVGALASSMSSSCFCRRASWSCSGGVAPEYSVPTVRQVWQVVRFAVVSCNIDEYALRHHKRNPDLKLPTVNRR